MGESSPTRRDEVRACAEIARGNAVMRLLRGAMYLGYYRGVWWRRGELTGC